MSAEPQQGSLSAAFPAPPPFYKAFTAENLERLRQHQTSKNSSEETNQIARDSEALDSNLLSSDLQYLLPPCPPADGKYRSFGTDYDITPAKIAQAPPTRESLLKLADRLLQLYLHYVNILATDPSGLLWVPQWEEIRKTFEGIHQIINEYRPHQARETMVLLMEDQVKKLKDETEELKSHVAKAKDVLSTLATGKKDLAAGILIPQSGANGEMANVDSKIAPKDNGKAIWETLEKELNSDQE